MSDSESTPRRRNMVEVTEGVQGVAVRIPGEPAGFELNPSAYAIWNLCDGLTTTREMAEAISELTGASVQSELDEVESVITELRQAGLVE